VTDGRTDDRQTQSVRRSRRGHTADGELIDQFVRSSVDVTLADVLSRRLVDLQRRDGQTQPRVDAKLGGVRMRAVDAAPGRDELRPRTGVVDVVDPANRARAGRRQIARQRHAASGDSRHTPLPDAVDAPPTSSSGH